jgi:hypothetical protein
MRESIKVLCAGVLLFAVPAAAVVWFDDAPGPVYPILRFACPILAILAIAIFLKLHFRADEVPDFLHRQMGSYFNRGGLCFNLQAIEEDGICVLAVFFQNQRDAPCQGRIAIRPARGFFLGRANIDTIAVDIACEPAAFGIAKIPLAVPAQLRGKWQPFEVGASVEFPQGAGKLLRFRDGVALRSNSQFGNPFGTTLTVVGALTGQIVLASPATIKLQLPNNVVEHSMSDHVILLSIPGLRLQDVAHMPNLARLTGGGDGTAIVPSFPCVTWPVQANMLTGKLPAEHGVVANGFYWRDTGKWRCGPPGTTKSSSRRSGTACTSATAGSLRPSGFRCSARAAGPTTSACRLRCTIPTAANRCGVIPSRWNCTAELRDALGHFPLKHFWGPLANISPRPGSPIRPLRDAAASARTSSTSTCPTSTTRRRRPAPTAPRRWQAVKELDDVIGRLDRAGRAAAYQGHNLMWLVASEYTITPVDHVSYPNRVLREAGLLQPLSDEGAGELIDFGNTPAWALVDHQLSHVFVKDRDDETIDRVVELFRGHAGDCRSARCAERGRNTPSTTSAPAMSCSSQRPIAGRHITIGSTTPRRRQFARTVDIHNKPGYDPVELHFDMATKSIPLDADAGEGLARRPAHHRRPTRHPPQQPAGHVRRTGAGGYGCVRPGFEAVWGLAKLRAHECQPGDIRRCLPRLSCWWWVRLACMRR